MTEQEYKDDIEQLEIELEIADIAMKLLAEQIPYSEGCDRISFAKEQAAIIREKEYLDASREAEDDFNFLMKRIDY